MRIAMVGPFGLHPNKTMASRAFNLAKGLVQLGHQVAIFMPPWQTPEEAGRHWSEQGVLLRYTPLTGGTLGIARSLLRETLGWQPDVVHSFKPKAYSGLVAWWLWHFHRHRLHLVTDTDDWEGWGGWNDRAPYTAAQKQLFARQEQWGLRHCHKLTVASHALETIAWSHGIAAGKVIYLPNGPGITVPAAANLQQLSGRRRRALELGDRPTLLLYSRLFEFSAARLVRILAQVKKGVPDLVVVAIGAGLYEAEASDLRTQLAAHDLMSSVFDLGWLEPHDLPVNLAMTHVGLYLMEDDLLNRTKCPVKLADMLAAGVPVVGENVGQVPAYVVSGKSGQLCAAGDEQAIVAALTRLLHDEEQRRRLSAGAQAHVSAHFDWQQLAARLEEAYVN